MSNHKYETVLAQALALSPEDRERLINQLAAEGRSLANGLSTPATDMNPGSVEYLTPQHPNANWTSPIEWLRINRERYPGQWVGLDGGGWLRMGQWLLRFLQPCALKEFPFHSLLSFLKKPKKTGRGSLTFSEYGIEDYRI